MEQGEVLVNSTGGRIGPTVPLGGVLVPHSRVEYWSHSAGWSISSTEHAE